MAAHEATPRGSRTGGVRIVAGLVVLGVLAGTLWMVFTGRLAVRSSVEIVQAEPRPQSQLLLAVAACGVQPHLASLEESETAVQVGVWIWRTFPSGGPDCSDTITLDLSEPLGTRDVIDASTGSPVPPPS